MFGFNCFKVSLHTSGCAVPSPEETVGIRSDLDQRARFAAALNEANRCIGPSTSAVKTEPREWNAQFRAHVDDAADALFVHDEAAIGSTPSK
jgi:hypothetical protein